MTMRRPAPGYIHDASLDVLREAVDRATCEPPAIA